eukprot:gene9699-10536_t
MSTNRIALVTGSNKGIGFEIVRGLVRKGYTALLCARNVENGDTAVKKLKQENPDYKIFSLVLDVTKPDTITQAVDFIQRRFGRLDVLVNNAAIANLVEDGLPGVANLDAVKEIYETNFFGVIRVTQALLPLIKLSSSGRIVNVSSELGSLNGHADPNWAYAAIKPLGYASSKAALNMFTIQLAYELRDTNIKVNSSNPGYTATDLNKHTGFKTVEDGASDPLRMALLEDDGPTGQFTSDGSIHPW